MNLHFTKTAALKFEKQDIFHMHGVEVFLIYIHGLMIEVDHFAVVADKIEIMNISDFSAEADSQVNKI